MSTEQKRTTNTETAAKKGLFASMTLKWKLTLGFGAVLVLTGAVAYVGHHSVDRVDDCLTEVGTVRLPSIEGLLEVRSGALGVRATNAALMVESLPANLRAAQHAAQKASWHELEEGWKLYEPLPQTPEEAVTWKDFVPAFHAWEQTAKDTYALIGRWEELRAQNKPEEAAKVYQAASEKFMLVGAQFKTMNELLQKINDLNNNIAAEAVSQGKSTAVSAGRTLIGASVGAALIGFTVAVLLTRSITRRARVLLDRAQAIANADLTGEPLAVTSNDELGKLTGAVNAMSQSLNTLIAEVKAGTSQIDAGGSQIASASQSLAQGASEQASSLQQISASIEEMSGQTKQSAENARQANALAEESKKSADRGQQEMVQMSKAVGEIKQSSAEISKIIKVIDEIAFQTNLLALNAAVEAARAGEAGKGFAVVAEEVRNLAQRSAEAAKSTSAMIEESVRRSENGVQIAGRVGQSLEEITAAAAKVNTLLSEIASAAGEQATGIGQVNQGVSQLDQVTQQNAGNSEEMASSAEELSSQVASLNELVAQFKVNSGGSAHRAVPTPKAPVPAQTSKKTKTPASKPGKNAAADAEKLIPMDNDEVLASF